MVYSLDRLTLVLGTMLTFAVALPLHAQEGAPPAPPQAKLPSIVVTDVVTRALTNRVTATGTIRPIDEIYIQPLVEGLSVKSVNVDVGDEVKAGDVLASLNEDALLLQKSQFEANKAKAEAAVAQYQAQVLEAEATLADAVRQRDRTQKLSQSGTSTVSQLEQATAQVEIGEARLNAARQSVTVSKSAKSLGTLGSACSTASKPPGTNGASFARMASTSSSAPAFSPTARARITNCFIERVRPCSTWSRSDLMKGFFSMPPMRSIASKL